MGEESENGNEYVDDVGFEESPTGNTLTTKPPPSPKSQLPKKQVRCRACKENGHTSRNKNCRIKQDQQRQKEEELQRKAQDDERRQEDDLAEQRRRQQIDQTEKNRRQEAEERTIYRLMAQLDWDKDDESMPPDLNAIMTKPPSEEVQLRTAAVKQYACLVEGKEALRLEGTLLVDFCLSCAPTTMEKEAAQRTIEHLATMRDRWAARDVKSEARRKERYQMLREHQEINGFNMRQIEIITDDVMEEILHYYRIEGLFGLPPRKDPTRDGGKPLSDGVTIPHREGGHKAAHHMHQ